MFGHFQNRVLELHREAIGTLRLGDLACGTWRNLSTEELHALQTPAPE
jgi:16S rRNA U516 pseudouridylate synthase RsuA-like enzyme